MLKLLEHILKEVSVAGINRKQKSITKLFPSFPDRVKAVADKGGLRLRDIDETSWHFKVHSGTTDVWYDAVLSFKNIVPTLERLVKDRRLWTIDKSVVDLRKLAKRFLEIADVQVACSCPAAKFWGPDYILSLSRYDGKFGDRETRPPRVRNPRQYGMICKHLANVMKVLPFYKTTLAKWLKDFYSDEIAEFEQEAKEEFGWVKAVAKELGKKKEEEEK